MAISDSQKVDLLYKKLFGVAKTDLLANKSPSNESIASPHLTRGDTIWQQSDQIPTTAAAVSDLVQAYQTTSSIECSADTTTTPIGGVYPSWKTDLIDWIPPEFGASYFAKVYADTAGAANPVATGTQLSDSGVSGVGEWNFDYQSGVLNFIGGTIPSALTSGKVVYITGYRYIGPKGLGSFSNIGNLTAGTGNISTLFVGNLTSTNVFITGGNITANANITSGNVTANINGNVTGTFASFTGNVYAPWFIGNVDGSIGNFITSITSANIASGNSYINSSLVQLQNISITGNSIRSTGTDLIISANTTDPNNLIKFDSISAFVIPTGTDAQRPPNPTYGYVRYNTGKGSVEWWSGSEWASAIASITAETIYPNGTDVTYTLGQAATDISILVNINGTVQQPTTAYTVVGDQITFSEPPLVTDIIEIRYLAASTALVPSDWNGGDVGGTVNIQSTTDSVSTTTGALRIAGGAGIAGNLHIGGNLFLAGTNVLAYISSDTTSTAAISANLGAYQTYANANAATQVTSINTVNANIGAYQTYANTKIGTNSNSNLVVVSSAQSTSTTTGALVISGGTGIAGNLHVGGNISQQGAYYETYGNVSNTGGNLTCNFNLGSIFYVTLGANVTANFTNVNAIANTVTGATIIIDQGATAYRVANVQINGVNQTVKWVGATTGTGTASNTDIISFSLIFLGGSAYRVLGQISNYG
jgi:hypothetical protein